MRLHPLPHYGSLRDLLGVARAIPPTIRALWRALGKVDLVWISASNPIGLILAGLAFLRRRRVAVLVRQDSMDYFRRRLPSRRWAPLLAPLWLVDWMYRALGTPGPDDRRGPRDRRGLPCPAVQRPCNSSSG